MTHFCYYSSMNSKKEAVQKQLKDKFVGHDRPPVPKPPVCTISRPPEGQYGQIGENIYKQFEGILCYPHL